MLVETTRFGPVEVSEHETVTFSDGLPGFRGARTMALLGAGELPGADPGAGHHTLFWLQDVHDPDLAFLTIVPWSAYPDYDIEIDPSDVGEADRDDLCVLAVVTVRREDGAVRATSNLLAPIVIDTRSRVGRQVILTDHDWPIHAPLAESPPAGTMTGGAGC